MPVRRFISALTVLLVLAGPGASAEAAVWRSKKGWPVTGMARISGAVLGDINRDGRAEIVAGGHREGKPEEHVVFVLDGQGRPLPGWPQLSGLKVSHCPLVGDVNGDGEPEVVAYDGLAVTVWNARGKLLGKRARPVPGMQGEMHTDAGAALGDLDGDGVLELVYGMWGPAVAAVRLRGAPEQLPGFPATIGGSVGGSPAVADLDGDGRDEVVIVDESTGLYIIELEAGGAKIARGLDADGSPLLLKARSSPAIGDLDGRGGLSILVGSYPGFLYAFDAQGRLKWSHRTGGNLHTAPALADVDGDGRREVVFTSYDGKLYVLTPEGKPHELWRDASLPWLGTVAVAGDIDDDVLSEIVLLSRNSLIVTGLGGALMRRLDNFGRPILGDIDGDARADLLVLQIDGIDCLELPSRPGAPLAWPSDRHDARRSGFAGPLQAPKTSP